MSLAFKTHRVTAPREIKLLVIQQPGCERGTRQLHLPCSGTAHQKQRAAVMARRNSCCILSHPQISTRGSSDPTCFSTTCSAFQISAPDNFILARQCNLMYDMLSTRPPPLLLIPAQLAFGGTCFTNRESLFNYQHPQPEITQVYKGELPPCTLEEKEAFTERTLSTALNSTSRAVFI